MYIFDILRPITPNSVVVIYFILKQYHCMKKMAFDTVMSVYDEIVGNNIISITQYDLDALCKKTLYQMSLTKAFYLKFIKKDDEVYRKSFDSFEHIHMDRFSVSNNAKTIKDKDDKVIIIKNGKGQTKLIKPKLDSQDMETEGSIYIGFGNTDLTHYVKSIVSNAPTDFTACLTVRELIGIYLIDLKSSIWQYKALHSFVNTLYSSGCKVVTLNLCMEEKEYKENYILVVK